MDIPAYLPEVLPNEHNWVAGMMYVSEEDVEDIARNRHVECEKCKMSYESGKDFECEG